MNLRINEDLLVSSRRECRYAGVFQARRGRETWGLRWVQTWYQQKGPKRRKFRRIRTTRRSQTVCLQIRRHRRSSSSTSAFASPSPHLAIASSSGSLTLSSFFFDPDEWWRQLSLSLYSFLLNKFEKEAKKKKKGRVLRITYCCYELAVVTPMKGWTERCVYGVLPDWKMETFMVNLILQILLLYTWRVLVDYLTSTRHLLFGLYWWIIWASWMDTITWKGLKGVLPFSQSSSFSYKMYLYHRINTVCPYFCLRTKKKKRIQFKSQAKNALLIIC